MNHNNFYTTHIALFVLTYHIDKIYKNTTAGNSHIYNFRFNEFYFNYIYIQYKTDLSEHISQLF